MRVRHGAIGLLLLVLAGGCKASPPSAPAPPLAPSVTVASDTPPVTVASGAPSVTVASGTPAAGGAETPDLLPSPSAEAPAVPDDPRAAWLWLMAQPYTSDAAVKILREAAAAHPGEALRHAALGAALLTSDQAPMARVSLEQALRLDPRCALAHAFTGDLALHEGDTEAAARAYHTAADLCAKGDPVDAVTADHRLTAMLLWSGDERGARAALRHGETSLPQKTGALRALLQRDQALVSDTAGDHAAAARWLAKAAAANRTRTADLEWAGYLIITGRAKAADPTLRRLATTSGNGETLPALRDEARRRAISVFRADCVIQQRARAWKIPR